MPSGGARNRSGPQADPSSGRSDRRGYTLTALPSEGYGREVPEYPLPKVTRYEIVFEDKARLKLPDAAATELYRSRELDVWAEAWTTPQACAWSMESWRWTILAEYCRLKTIVEMDADASAALVGQLHRFRDQLGLTPAGLKDNGWAIAVDEVGEKRDEKTVEPSVPVRRLRAVPGE